MTPLVRMLAQYWRLDERLARRWWEGVARARWSLAQGWRRQVLLFDKGIAPTLAAPQVCEAARRRTRSGGFRRSSDGSGRSSTRPRSRGRADGTEAPRRRTCRQPALRAIVAPCAVPHQKTGRPTEGTATARPARLGASLRASDALTHSYTLGKHGL